MHSGTLSSFCCSFFRSASEKRTTDEMGSTIAAAGKVAFESVTT
jgi:hypothetical protein